MSKAREETFAKILPAYEDMRLKLTEAEKPLFDKAMALLEELTRVDTAHTLCLDAAISVGISSIGLTPLSKVQIVPMLARMLKNLCALDEEVRNHGSSYRH